VSVRAELSTGQARGEAREVKARQKPRTGIRHLTVCLLGLAVAALGVAAQAQQVAPSVMKGYSVPDYYPPPHQTQLRSLLKGGEATLKPGEPVQVRRVTVERFLETGTREMLLEVPECSFDYTTREAWSPGPLKVQLQEGRFTLEGEGFFWQHTNLLLVISNRVRTDIRGGLVSQGTAPALGEARVVADQFVYDGQTTQAVYRGHVRVTGTNLALACGWLGFTLPATSAGVVDQLLAEQDVAIDFGDLHASGDHAVYAPGTGAMQLTGKAAWQAQGREGRGDELWLDSSTLSLRARGGAMLKLPVSGAGFIAQPEDAAVPPVETTNRFVTITSERYELQTNQVSFSGGVQMVERNGEVVNSRLACDSLSATFGPSNQVQTLVAEQGVVIEQGGRRLTGARATYDGATSAMQLTGQPEWRDGDRSGAGELLLANLRQNQFAVHGHASLSLPHTEAGGLFDALVGTTTNRSAKLAKTNAVAAPPTRITSDDYTFAPEEAVFRGHVVVDDAQMQLTTDALTLKLAPGGTNIVSITAEHNIVMSLVETNGQVTRVTCAQAVYAATNGVLELTGQPQVNRSDGSWFNAEVIGYNPATGSLSARRGMRGRIVEPASSATNAPALPFNAKPGKRKK
jgi:lipopolysaccharide export system protein LptA